MDAPVDARIRAVAARQRGRVTRCQLLFCGVPAETIARRVRSGHLEWVHRGVYGLPGTASLPLAAEAAAVLACGRGAVLSHHSAVTLWGLRPGTARPIHVTIRMGRSGPSLDGVLVHRSRILTPADITVRDGLPVTSPARAMLDAAATLPDRDVERLIAEGVFVLKVVTPRQIRDVLARAGGHPGRARLARVAAMSGPLNRTESPAEETLLGLIREAGLPRPLTQVPMLDYNLDLYWPDLDLAVEVDAYGTHGSPRRFEADRRRDARLLIERGIVVVRLTKPGIEERPIETVAILARAIAGRAMAR